MNRAKWSKYVLNWILRDVYTFLPGLKLTQLTLPGRHSVTDSGLSFLSRLSLLLELDLTDYTQVTDQGVSQLSTMNRSFPHLYCTIHAGHYNTYSSIITTAILTGVLCVICVGWRSCHLATLRWQMQGFPLCVACRNCRSFVWTEQQSPAEEWPNSSPICRTSRWFYWGHLCICSSVSCLAEA